MRCVATIGSSATARWLEDKNIGFESVTDLNATAFCVLLALY